MKTCNLLLIMAIVAGSGVMHPTAASGGEVKHSHEASSAAKHEGFGVIKEVNGAGGKVKIAHEPIPALKWPGMTMWFKLQGSLASEIKPGDSVHFELQQGKPGEWVISRIERRK